MIYKVNNKLIAKNTMILYFRMFFLLLISLYTSRVVLRSLGVEDYGIYHVVGGLVALFAIIRDSFNTSITRHLTYEIGAPKGDLRTIFITSILIQSLIAVVIIFLGETVGLWFLFNKLVIPSTRIYIALWCYQFALFDFVIRLLSIPYNSIIIANERISVLAYMSILDGIGQLFIAISISYSSYDKLFFYSFLMCVLSLFMRVVYVFYCKRHFEACCGNWLFNKKIFVNMFSFAGWNMIGSASYQLMTQGINILLNIFYGITVNAASAIASKVGSFLTLLVNNFTRALNPQIIKTYATGQKKDCFNLMFKGAKFSYFLMLFVAIPIFFETQQILEIWLVSVPAHTSAFVKLSIVVTMVEILSNSMETAIVAHGDVRKFQLFVRGVGFIVIPLSLLFIWMGYPPEMIYTATVITTILMLVIKSFVLSEQVGMPLDRYFNEVIIKAIITTLLSVIIPVIICIYMKDSTTRLIIVACFSILNTIVAVYLYGITKLERIILINYINNTLSRIRK